MSWRFQAQKSTETYPGAWYGVRTDRSSCVAIGNDAWCAQGGYCSVPEGTDFVFQGPHCSYTEENCTSNIDCPTPVGHCSLSQSACTVNADCPTHYWCDPIFHIFCFFWFAETCEGFEQDTCLSGNEVTFSLQPGEGILLNGEASQYNECRGAECSGGPLAGEPCDPFNAAATCCPQSCTTPPGAPDPPLLCSSDSDCPRFCTDTSTECTSDANCTSPATCGPNTVCEAACTGITCEAPFADNHVIYSKSLSYETLQYGFTVEIARLTDATDAQQFSLTLIVEIIVE